MVESCSGQQFSPPTYGRVLGCQQYSNNAGKIRAPCKSLVFSTEPRRNSSGLDVGLCQVACGSRVLENGETCLYSSWEELGSEGGSNFSGLGRKGKSPNGSSSVDEMDLFSCTRNFASPEGDPTILWNGPASFMDDVSPKLDESLSDTARSSSSSDANSRSAQAGYNDGKSLERVKRISTESCCQNPLFDLEQLRGTGSSPGGAKSVKIESVEDTPVTKATKPSSFENAIMESNFVGRDKFFKNNRRRVEVSKQSEAMSSDSCLTKHCDGKEYIASDGVVQRASETVSRNSGCSVREKQLEISLRIDLKGESAATIKSRANFCLGMLDKNLTRSTKVSSPENMTKFGEKQMLRNSGKRFLNKRNGNVSNLKRSLKGLENSLSSFRIGPYDSWCPNFPLRKSLSFNSSAVPAGCKAVVLAESNKTLPPYTGGQYQTVTTDALRQLEKQQELEDIKSLSYEGLSYKSYCDISFNSSAPESESRIGKEGDASETAFMFHVKARVAQIRRKSHRTRLDIGKNGGELLGEGALSRRRYRQSAFERAEQRFNQGALLSDTDSDNSEPDESQCSFSNVANESDRGRSKNNFESNSDGKSYSSYGSDRAVVEGRINLERGFRALRSKMLREGKSEAEVKFELSCRMKPEEGRRERRKRRRISNISALEMKRKIEMAKETSLNQKGNDSVNVTRIDPSKLYSSNLAHGMSEAGGAAYWDRVNDFSEKKSCASGSDRAVHSGSNSVKKYTKDEKLLARKKRKIITGVLAELQKLRDRGCLLNSQFEREKAKVFDLIFKRDKNGRVCLVEQTYASLKGLEQRNENISSRSLKVHARFGDTDDIETDILRKPLTDNDTKLFNEYLINEHLQSQSNGNYNTTINEIRSSTGSSFPNDFSGCVVSSKTVKDQLRHSIYKTMKRKFINAERKQMLMRKFDQRAPPHERMFKQDTSYNGKPSRKQLEDWALWNKPSILLPPWMKDQSVKPIVFPKLRARSAGNL